MAATWRAPAACRPMAWPMALDRAEAVQGGAGRRRSRPGVRRRHRRGARGQRRAGLRRPGQERGRPGRARADRRGRGPLFGAGRDRRRAGRRRPGRRSGRLQPGIDASQRRRTGRGPVPAPGRLRLARAGRFRAAARAFERRQGAGRDRRQLRDAHLLRGRRGLAESGPAADAHHRLPAADRAPVRNSGRRRAGRRPLHRPPIQGLARSHPRRFQAPARDHPLRRRGIGGPDRAAEPGADLHVRLRPS